MALASLPCLALKGLCQLVEYARTLKRRLRADKYDPIILVDPLPHHSVQSLSWGSHLGKKEGLDSSFCKRIIQHPSKTLIWATVADETRVFGYYLVPSFNHGYDVIVTVNHLISEVQKMSEHVSSYGGYRIERSAR
jgi:hypothetical protein